MKHLKLMSICMLILTTSIITGCNTMYGAGKDLQEGGKSLSKAAEDHK